MLREQVNCFTCGAGIEKAELIATSHGGEVRCEASTVHVMKDPTHGAIIFHGIAGNKLIK